MKRVWTLVVLLSASGALANWWADFSNNLFTDLTPLITLFGEQPTKQFLSESLTYLDYFIFAMAPLGVLTAVISAVRIRGGTSLRAFIGRAQEGAGAIEAELCSSTSRDICELYVNGGIARVFGTPRLLELVHDPEAGEDEFIDRYDVDSTAGLYTPRSYLSGDFNNAQKRTRGWKEITSTPHSPNDVEASISKKTGKSRHTRDNLWAPAPNLTMALWMQRPHKMFVWLAAGSGFVLQAGVLAVAAVVTHRLRLKVDDEAPMAYGFPLMVSGTVLLCTGNFLCAFIVGEITRERVFERLPASKSDGQTSQPTRMVWMQPGGQVIGDQTFDCFAYNDVRDPNRQYVTSWKDVSQPDGGIVVWLGIICSTLGFVAQFVGLRGLHPLVSVAQLGAILAMSTIRSFLRTQRLSRGFNLLDRFSSVLKSHELDWLAMHLELDGKRGDGRSFIEDICAMNESVNSNQPVFWVGGRTVEHKRVHLLHRRHSPGLQSVRVVGAIEGPGSHAGGIKLDEFLSTRPLSATSALRILAYRTRLARLTNRERPANDWEKLPAGFLNWDRDHISCRNQAEALASVIKQTAEFIFTDESPFWDDNWRGACGFSWAVSCHSSAGTGLEKGSFFLNIQRLTENDPWEADVSVLEAVLGLWAMSLEVDPKTKYYDYDRAIDSISMGSGTRSHNEVIIASQYEAGGITEMRSGIDVHELRRLWLGRDRGNKGREYRARRVRLESLDRSISRHGNTYTVWDRQPSDRGGIEVKPRKVFLPRTLERRECFRFFGWNAFLDAEEINSKSTSGSPEVMLVTRDTASSLTSLCAQELYASFMRAILSLLDCRKSVSGITASGKKFRLKHALLDRCFDVFTDHKLGSRQDAVHCVFPSIAPSIKVTPNRGQFIQLVYSKSQQLRRSKDWEQAGRIFLWASKAALVIGNKELDGFTQRSVTNLFLVFYKKAFHDHPEDSDLFTTAKTALTKRGGRSRQALEGWLPLFPSFNFRESSSMHSARPSIQSQTLGQAMSDRRYKETFFLFESGDSQQDWMDLSVLIHVIQHSATESQDPNQQSEEEMYATVLVEALLDGGAFDCNAIDENSTPLLSIAVQRGAIWAVESLIRRGANPSVKDIEHMTPLHWAAKNGSARIVELLLSNEAVNMTIKDEHGCTFLDYVAERQGGLKHDVLKAVLEFPESHEYILDWALRRLNEKDVLEALELIFSTSFSIPLFEGDLLKVAVWREWAKSPHWSPETLEKVLQTLIQNGFSVESSGDHARVFVHAAELEPESTLALLLKLNPDFINCQATTPYGALANALMAAAGVHDLSKVMFLLDNGASREPVGSQTALHFAMKYILPPLTHNAFTVRVEELVKLLQVLIEAGVRKDVVDKQGKTAWDYAHQVRRGGEQWKMVLDVLDPSRGQKDS